jgi:hypothetical protein
MNNVPSEVHPVEGYISFEEICTRIYCCLKLKLAKGSTLDLVKQELNVSMFYFYSGF